MAALKQAAALLLRDAGLAVLDQAGPSVLAGYGEGSENMLWKRGEDARRAAPWAWGKTSLKQAEAWAVEARAGLEQTVSSAH